MTEERERTNVVPYALAIGFIQYVMLCTAPDMCLAMCLARGYKGDQGVDHRTTVKIVLGVIRTCFLIMKVIKSSA